MKSPAFQFYVKQWLGDDTVLLMDWDARGMHVHLMCIAWQQDPPCTLPDDDDQWRKWCGNPRRNKWVKSRDMIQRAWKKCDGRWVQEGLLREYEKQRKYSESRQQAAQARWGKSDANALRMDSVCNALQSSFSSSELKTKTISVSHAKDGGISLNGQGASFEMFWAVYPRKEGKGACRRWWKAHKPDDVLLGLMLNKIEQAKSTRKWQDEGGKFIPMPLTWLNQERWEDEYAAEMRQKARIPL